MEENKISVYAKINGNNEIVEVNSDIFIKEFSDWIKIDEGEGDKFVHAQSNYFDKSLIDEGGGYNFKYQNGQIIEIEHDKVLLESIENTEQEIYKLKQQLSDMDYKTSKYVDGDYTEEEWLEIVSKRKAIRTKIRELEALLEDEV